MSFYWTTPNIGLAFKAQAEATEPQYFQREVWIQVHFRNEYFDTAQQYFPPISTFEPYAAGKYNIRAQVQIDNIFADAPSGTDKHRIRVALRQGVIQIAESSTIISNYYPDDPREDATAEVETIFDLTEAHITASNNKFTAWIYIENIREDEIPATYNPFPGFEDCTPPTVYGCTAPGAQNITPGATVDDGSCYYNQGCPNPDYLDFWNTVSDNDPTDLAKQGTTPIDFSNNNLCATSTVYGCTTATDLNFNPYANVNDGSCEN